MKYLTLSVALCALAIAGPMTSAAPSLVPEGRIESLAPRDGTDVALERRSVWTMGSIGTAAYQWHKKDKCEDKLKDAEKQIAALKAQITGMGGKPIDP